MVMAIRWCVRILLLLCSCSYWRKWTVLRYNVDVFVQQDMKIKSKSTRDLCNALSIQFNSSVHFFYFNQKSKLSSEMKSNSGEPTFWTFPWHEKRQTCYARTTNVKHLKRKREKGFDLCELAPSRWSMGKKWECISRWIASVPVYGSIIHVHLPASPAKQ